MADTRQNEQDMRPGRQAGKDSPGLASNTNVATGRHARMRDVGSGMSRTEEE